MKRKTETVTIVNCSDIQEALELQGVEDFEMVGDWFSYQSVGTDCYHFLGQDRKPIENPYDDEDVRWNFVLQCLKDMFGDEKILVEISY